MSVENDDGDDQDVLDAIWDENDIAIAVDMVETNDDNDIQKDIYQNKNGVNGESAGDDIIGNDDEKTISISSKDIEILNDILADDDSDINDESSSDEP